jgi:hypothetical protein
MGAPVLPGSPGLPEGRVYEQVSPRLKSGAQAGAQIVESFSSERSRNSSVSYALARADGNGVLFWANGPIGDSAAGYNNTYFVAQRSAVGWTTRSATPRTLEPFVNVLVPVNWLTPSADFSHVAFTSPGHQYVPPPDARCSSNSFVMGPDPSLMPSWIAQPEIPAPAVDCLGRLAIVGGTPDLGTVYYSYAGTLLPEDASRVPHLASGGGVVAGPWGFYEYRKGAVQEVGVLPNGLLDPCGAVPPVVGGSLDSVPANGHVATSTNAGNDVSGDGSRAFFISPDPRFAQDENGNAECTTARPELYLRETVPDGSRSTRLVSADPLLPKVNGLSAPAPHGSLGIASAAHGWSFLYASPDGSHAFFESTDQLTSVAPSDTKPKTYQFDVGTGSLRYLPGVVGPIVASTRDGSSFSFENTVTSPPELDRWSGAPGNEVVTTITKLPGERDCAIPLREKDESIYSPNTVCVSAARTSADGSVLVFATRAPLSGFNNGGGLYEEIYRYAAATNELSCVSCPPAGITPTGNARVSLADQLGNGGEVGEGDNGPIDERGVSSDGGRIFFDTPDPLVPQDVNGTRDVYEWNDGHVYLISSGQSPHESMLLDSSEDGGDVFFATTDGLAVGDTDGGYDVYDARIPHPGDNPPPAAVSCQGDVCQGPPSVLLVGGAPSSATLNGSGNLTAQTDTKSASQKRKGKHKRHRKRKKRSKTRRRKTPDTTPKTSLDRRRSW